MTNKNNEFSTPKEFKELLSQFIPLNDKKYIVLAREAIKLARSYPEYRKGIMATMNDLTSEVGIKNSKHYWELSDLGTEFGTFDYRDDISENDLDYLENFTNEIEEKLRTSKQFTF